MKEIWKEKRVVRDWKDAEIVPIPKKGILSHVTIGKVSILLMLLERSSLE